MVARGGGACVVAPVGGGMHGCSQGGHVWLFPGGMCGCSWGGMCGFFWGACMAFSGGVCMFFSRGCAWFFLGGACVAFSGGMHGFFWEGMCRIRRDTVNERAVRILLECFLVFQYFFHAINFLELHQG